MVGDEVTFGDVPLCGTYGLVVKHFEEEPPEPKTEKVEIPFGEDVDITDAFGEVAFSNRSMTIDFLALCGGGKFRALMSEIMALLHGVRSTFELSQDPGYTYQGRFRVIDADYSDSRFGSLTLEVDVDPWKILPDREYTFSAYPAVVKQFESGRKPVRPEVTTQVRVMVTYNSVSEEFAPGTHSSANLSFRWGVQDVKFEALDWVFYQDGETMVFNDDLIEYDQGSSTITLEDEVIESLYQGWMTMDNSKQYVTVRYQWRDI